MILRAPSTSSRFRVGVSGWTYGPWRGVFFPEDLPQRRELEFASRQLNSIEINGSFYSLQSSASYHKWFAATPDDFVFSVKGGRFITHLKRLNEPETPLANFFASGVLALKHKLGPILWQLPPSLKYERKVLAKFLRCLPHDTHAACRLARKHNSKVAGKCFIETDAKRPVRHALEIRHPSFETEEFIALLREHDIAVVVADTAGRWPLIEDVTGGFVYVRLHGDEELYTSGYTNEALDRWASKIRSWGRGNNPRGTRRISRQLPPKSRGRDVFVYFDNDVKVRAPFDAHALGQRLGLPEPVPFH